MIDNREIDEKYYRVIRKKDSHINTKLNSDGSKSAIQFTDDGNELNGPLDIIEVDEQELMKINYVDEYNKPRTFKEIIIEDVIIPVAREAIYNALTIGYDKVSQQLKTKSVPKLKQKLVTMFKDVKIIASGIKDGISGKEPKFVRFLKRNEKTEKAINIDEVIEKIEQEKIVRTEEEIIDIMTVMQTSAITLAACIRILNNTVVADDGKSPEKRMEIQENIKALTTIDVMSQIELLLEEKNKGLLDEASRLLLSNFRDGFFVAEDRRIPIAIYIE